MNPTLRWSWLFPNFVFAFPLFFSSSQEEVYKKSLLISRKDKKDMGFEVKLKKEIVLDT